MDRTYAGSCTWLNGVFWVEVEKVDRNRVIIRNLADVGKNKVDSVTMPVEDEFLFPLLRGRDVRAWRAEPSALIVVPHYKENFSEPIKLSDFRRKDAFEFFRRFEKELKARSGYKQLYNKRPEFYVVGNTGNYLLAPYKVVFKDLAEIFQCAVVGPKGFGNLSSRPAVPDHTLLFMACDNEDEAYFYAGLLNSAPARSALYSASVGVQTQRYFPTDVSRVLLPNFDKGNGNHREVVRLSRECHDNPAEQDMRAHLSEGETKLSTAASEIWNISRKELKHIFDYYGEIQVLRGRRPEHGEAG